MKFDKDTVYTLRMANGDEWVAKIERIEDDVLIINKPAAVMMGQAGPELFAALFTADNEKSFSINKQHVVGWIPTKKTIAESYITATTGVIVPEKKIIMG